MPYSGSESNCSSLAAMATSYLASFPQGDDGAIFGHISEGARYLELAAESYLAGIEKPQPQVCRLG